jgi:hypothetical protein
MLLAKSDHASFQFGDVSGLFGVTANSTVIHHIRPLIRQSLQICSFSSCNRISWHYRYYRYHPSQLDPANQSPLSHPKSLQYQSMSIRHSVLTSSIQVAGMGVSLLAFLRWRVDIATLLLLQSVKSLVPVIPGLLFENRFELRIRLVELLADALVMV